MIKIWDNATLVALVEGCLGMQTAYSALFRVSLVLTLSQNSAMGWNINNVYMLKHLVTSTQSHLKQYTGASQNDLKNNLFYSNFC